MCHIIPINLLPVLYCGTGGLGDSCTVNENVGQFFVWSWIPQFGDLTGHAYVAAGKLNMVFDSSQLNQLQQQQLYLHSSSSKYSHGQKFGIFFWKGDKNESVY